MNPQDANAFRLPQYVRPGCKHQLACKCVPPFHLRASTPLEQAREEFMRRPFIFPTTPEHLNGDGDGK